MMNTISMSYTYTCILYESTHMLFLLKSRFHGKRGTFSADIVQHF